jgi:RimJ/RimL family protein N-acetyltransferase
MVNLKLAVINHAEHLCEIKSRAYSNEQFEDDITSLDWHQNMINHSLYYAIFYDDILIGGVSLQPDRNNGYCLSSIFIEPGLQKRGFGSTAMRLLEEKYPSWVKWVVETSEAVNKYFLEKCGYHFKTDFVVNESERKVYVYEKTR